jgi:S1-C subfamily serine protease
VGIVSLYFPGGQNLNFAVSAQGVPGLRTGPGQTLEERAALWLKEAQDLVKEGRKHLGDKDHAKALKTLQLAVKTKPDLAEARYYLGLAYLKAGQQEEANKELAWLMGLDPKLADELKAAFRTADKSPADMLPDIIRRIKPAVVMVITFDAHGKKTGFGSGFFINKEGHFITNYHVLEGFHHAEVKTAKGDRFSVTRILGEDKKGDLALGAVKLAEGVSVPFLTVSELLPEVGERIIAVGNPEGFELTSSDGIVSALRHFENVGTVIQMTAAISPGSSGGPVANLKGQVIGVSTFFWTQGQNLNFAVPGQRVRSLFKH